MARAPHTVEQALDLLRPHGSEKNRAGMARYGINVDKAFGVSMPNIRAAGKAITHDHDLARALWDTGIHEARILAALVDKPQWVTREQMERWVADFNSWDLCDQVCSNLFDKTPHAHDKAVQWAGDEREFVKRAGFTLMACRAVHDKQAPDDTLESYLPLIRHEAHDPRNFVRKAVNWALRQIGKRSASLHGPCLDLAHELAGSDDRAARWIGKDAVKELESDAVKQRLGL